MTLTVEIQRNRQQHTSMREGWADSVQSDSKLYLQIGVNVPASQRFCSVDGSRFRLFWPLSQAGHCIMARTARHCEPVDHDDCTSI